MESLLSFTGKHAAAIATLLAPLFAGLLLAILGRLAYFRQKEFESIRERYLKDGVDVIAKRVEHNLNIFFTNYAKAHNVLRHFRDYGRSLPRDILRPDSFLDLDPDSLDTSRNYVLRELVGDDIYYDVYQKLNARVLGRINFFRYELCHGLTLFIDPTDDFAISASAEELYDKLHAELLGMDREMQRYFILLHHLRGISTILSSERFSLRGIRRFRYKQIVQRGLVVMREFSRDVTRKEGRMDLPDVTESQKHYEGEYGEANEWWRRLSRMRRRDLAFFTAIQGGAVSIIGSSLLALPAHGVALSIIAFLSAVVGLSNDRRLYAYIVGFRNRAMAIESVYDDLSLISTAQRQVQNTRFVMGSAVAFGGFYFVIAIGWILVWILNLTS